MMEKRQVLQTSLRKEFLKERRILLDFMDEYAEVMNKYTQAEVYNGFARGYTGLSITGSSQTRVGGGGGASVSG